MAGNENTVSESEASSMNNPSQNSDGSRTQAWFEAPKALPRLGLQLTITPSLLNEANRLLLQANNLKPEHFPISSLRIGSWERVSRNAGDLVAKCYFKKRKFAWEFLENGLKSKIEFYWDHILSLKVVRHEGQSEILEIELSLPPAFFHEIDPTPMKHTKWAMVFDFTGGQASICMKHHLKFSPGVLNRPFVKLLRNDSRLFQLSLQQQQPYQGRINNQMPIWEGQGQRINIQIPNQIRGSMMPTVPSNADSIISFENNYTPLSQNQLGGLISMQQHSLRFQTLNDDHQNVPLNHTQSEDNNSCSSSVNDNDDLLSHDQTND